LIRLNNNGTISGYHSTQGPNQQPHIIDLYAAPDLSVDSPLKALPNWFRYILTGPGGDFQILQQAVADMDDWGLAREITSSTTILRQSPSKSSSISTTSTPPKRVSHPVSPASCSPAPPSRLPRYRTYLGRLERYVQDGRGVVACHVASMFAPHHWKMTRDVHRHPS
jgi:hypothetical protein